MDLDGTSQFLKIHFSDTFLELGLVEVSSDGLNYFQFESTSLTQDTLQIDAFGTINPDDDK